MKSAKHVKMNMTSLVFQHFFKGLQQIGETEMMSRVNFGRNMYLIPYLVVFCQMFYFFILKKKVFFLIFIQNAK